MNKQKRLILHAHTDKGSNAKQLDCIVKTEELIKTCAEEGYYGVTITDHCCLSAHVTALEVGKEISSDFPDFKVVLGDEIYLVENRREEEKQKFYHFILLAKDEQGHRYLRELSSLAWDLSYRQGLALRTPVEYREIANIVLEQGHLIATSSCLGGFLPSLVTEYIATQNEEIKNKIDWFINWCLEIFGKEYFYIELQAGLGEEQINFNKMAIQIGNYYNIKCVIGMDIHYLRKEDRKVHEIYLKSRNAERELQDFYESCYLMDDEDIYTRMNYFSKEQINNFHENGMEIYNKIERYVLEKEVVIPERELPDFEIKHIFLDYYKKYKYIDLFANGKFQQDNFILSEIEKGFIAKKQEFNELNIERINRELETLYIISEKQNQRMSSYYNLTQLAIDIMWDDNKGNSLVGISRGSCSGMYICYLIDITQMNPIEWDLIDWRHLHKDRPELPDIDSDSEASKRQGIFQAFKENFGEDRVLNILTFRTETSKSAILTTCRGLDIPLEVAQELADLIPIVRGRPYTISETINGNEEDDKKPVREFINKASNYKGLIETALKIENLISGISIHASGVYIFNKHYIEQNSLMRAPNGQKITCWDMKDSDKCGSLKIDILTIQNLDSIRHTIELMIEAGVMEWQGSLRETYKKYIHPDVLEYQDENMWNILGTEKGNNIFQLSTSTGKNACRKIAPKNLKQMSLINSLMRLSPVNGEPPIDKYKKFKDDLNLWYLEMNEYGLIDNEVRIMEKYLLNNSGIACEQEDVMLIIQDKEISNFTMSEANYLRKGISKKSPKIISKCKDLFFSKGLDIGTRRLFLDYVWNEQISLSLGYSFSRNHTIPYSGIGLQQMNLLHKYPEVYSHTAFLLVKSSSDEGNESGKINYGIIGIAIAETKNMNVKFSLPYINSAKIGFVPDEETNSIIFGLKAINSVNDQQAHEIIDNRPYSSFDEFITKNNFPKKTIINLVKSGAFDLIENKKTRLELMNYYLLKLAMENKSEKKKLTGANLVNLYQLGLLSPNEAYFINYYNFDKYITNKEFYVEKVKNKQWLIARSDDVKLAKTFFEQNYLQELKEELEYRYTKDGIVFSKSAYTKIYKAKMSGFLEKINSPEFLERYNNSLYSSFVKEWWDKYCKGTPVDWEFEALSFYHSNNPLAIVNKEQYVITNFEDIPEQPIQEEEYQYRGKTMFKNRLFRIVGTILDTNKNKHTITLLTNNNEVVNVKMYSGSFIHYNKTITQVDTNGKKVTLENSWLERGNKILICGYRQEDIFRPKTYNNSVWQHTISLIEEINSDGSLIVRNLRYGQQEKSGYNK